MTRKIAILILVYIFIPIVVSAAFKLPGTGKTKCYQAESPYAEIPCFGTGQDGAYNFNPMYFSDNGNGTVMDNNTGLMWQKCSAGQSTDDSCSGTATTFNWFQASGISDTNFNQSSQNACGALNLGNYTDWRLPSKKELMSIVDYGVVNPGPTIKESFFPNTCASDYWSSTSDAANSEGAWGVNFYSGLADYSYGKGSNHYVRCVRGGQETATMIDNGNGTVTDNKTGLIWQQGEAGSMIFGSALSYCVGLSLAGHSDWRLPNLKELESLADDSRYNPALNTSFFSNAVASAYWSSTTDSSFQDVTWNVDFNHGFASGNVSGFSCPYKYNNNYVRCVRGGLSTLDGDLNGDGNVTVIDVLLALRVAVGVVTPTRIHYDHGDVAPQINGVPVPDGNISVEDALLVLQRAVGLVSWPVVSQRLPE